MRAMPRKGLCSMPNPDHKAEALRLLEESQGAPSDDPGCFALLQDALIHSNLAIAEEQGRVAEEIKGLRSALRAGSRVLGRAVRGDNP